jgi:hypothetical protein
MRQQRESNYGLEKYFLLLIGSLAVEDKQCARDFIAHYFDQFDARAEQQAKPLMSNSPRGKASALSIARIKKVLWPYIPPQQMRMIDLLWANLKPEMDGVPYLGLDSQYGCLGDAALDYAVMHELVCQLTLDAPTNYYQKMHETLTANATLAELTREIVYPDVPALQRENIRNLGTHYEILVGIIYQLNGGGNAGIEQVKRFFHDTIKHYAAIFHIYEGIRIYAEHVGETNTLHKYQQAWSQIEHNGARKSTRAEARLTVVPALVNRGALSAESM